MKSIVYLSLACVSLELSVHMLCTQPLRIMETKLSAFYINFSAGQGNKLGHVQTAPTFELHLYGSYGCLLFHYYIVAHYKLSIQWTN